MGYILAYINLIIIALAISIKFDKKLDITVFISIALISIIEYLIGILVNLVVANVSVICFTVVCLIYLIYKCIKNKDLKVITNQITIGFVLLTILYFISILLYREKMVIQHNELGFWALITKNMIFEDSLPKANTNILHLGYTPITGLWQYWFCNFFEEFKDGDVFISNTLLQYSLVIAITSFINEKSKIKKALINITVILVLFTVCYLAFTTLYIEVILGFISIFTIIYILKLNQIETKDVILLSLTFIFLTLAKDAGILFVVISLCFLLYKGLKNENKKSYVFLVVLLILVLSLGFKFLWNIYLGVNNLNNISADTSDLNIESIIELFKGEAQKYKYETIDKYFDYLFSRENFSLFNDINVSSISLLIIYVTIMLVLYIKKKDKEILQLLIIVVCINILFYIFLLGTYIFVFSEWEARMLSAIARYIQILNIINICALLYVIYEKCDHKKTILVAILIILALSGTNRGIEGIIKKEEKNQEKISQRDKYMGIEKYRDILNQEDKIYLVTEYIDKLDEGGKRELDLLSIKYQITPYRVYMYHSSIITTEQIINKLLCGYTYIYFHDDHEDIVNRYKFLLKENQNIEKDTLYKLQEENGKLVMDKVEL